MPKLPTNMIRRKGQPGYWFQRKTHGKRVRKYLGEDFEAAKLALNQLKAKEPQRAGAGPVTVTAAAERWLAEYVAVNRNPKGHALAKRRVELYLDPGLGRQLVDRLTKIHVHGYRLWLDKQKVKPETAVHVLSDARCFLGWCEEQGLVDSSPFPRKKIMPKIQEQAPDRLTDDEAAQVMALPDIHGFVCRLAIGTGLRWAELCRAQAKDVDANGRLLVAQTKSGKVRRVPLSPELLAEIRRHVGRLVPFSEKSPGSFARAVYNATDIEGFHVHQMRHTFACQWIEHGGSLAALQQILGHASVETTQRYARLSDDMTQREAERVHGNFRSGATSGATNVSSAGS